MVGTSRRCIPSDGMFITQNSSDCEKKCDVDHKSCSIILGSRWMHLHRAACRQKRCRWLLRGGSGAHSISGASSNSVGVASPLMMPWECVAAVLRSALDSDNHAVASMAGRMAVILFCPRNSCCLRGCRALLSVWVSDSGCSVPNITRIIVSIGLSCGSIFKTAGLAGWLNSVL